jgi:hypothetical protein
MGADPSDEARAGQIVLTAISPFVVGIFTKPDASHVGWTYGTGSPIVFDGRKFILTAAHVVPVAPSDIQFIPPPSDGFRISPSLSNGRLHKSQRYDLMSCIGNQMLDLAAILFNTPPKLAFFDLSNGAATTPAPGNQVVICGYPIAKERMVVLDGEVRSCAGPDFQCGTVLPSTSIRDMKSHQFAIDYPAMPGIVRPRGYSGSMVWYDAAGYRTIQDLQRELTIAAAGIITDHAISEQALLGTRIDKVVGFIKDQVIPSCLLCE